MFDDVPNGNQEMQGMSPQNTAEARVIVEILRTLLYTSIKEGAESPCSSPVLSVYTEVPLLDIGHFAYLSRVIGLSEHTYSQLST